MQNPFKALGREPTDPHQLFKELEQKQVADLNTRSGQVMGFAFELDRPEVIRAAERAYLLYLGHNGLDPTAFPSLAALENEVIGWTLENVNAPFGAVGTFTSGGTESIFLAARAARKIASDKGVSTPEMVLPITAHPAFHKAADYMGFTVRSVAVDADSFTVSPQSISQAVSPNTAMVVASAPSFAHGVVDPIDAIGDYCEQNNLWLHVDACVGGFLLPFFEALGADLPPFDFRNRGVRSISLDFHKYAFAPKGASAVLFRSFKDREASAFVCAKWPGYGIVNYGVQSSKSGGPVAATWTTLKAMGREGYLRVAEQLLVARQKLVDGISGIEQLRVLGNPAMSLVAFSSDTVDVFELHARLGKQGWHTRVQFSCPPSPPALHVLLNPVNGARVDDFLEVLKRAVIDLPPLRQTTLTIDPASVSDEDIDMLIMNNSPNSKDSSAGVNQMMGQLPVKLLERVMVRYMGRLLMAKPQG